MLLGGVAAGVVVESAPAGVGFDEFCAVEECSDAECKRVALAVAVTGSAAELTSVCTLVRLLEGAGKTTAPASESSFCKASESLAGALGVDPRAGCVAAVPMALEAMFLLELESRLPKTADAVASVAARIEGGTEASGALEVVGTDGDGG
jgi:hypothetical protein